MIIVVGTSHSIQRTSLELRGFLENACRQFDVNAIAEEMSEEALSQHGCAESVPMQVARALDIRHRLCDPSNAERAKLGIRQEADIRAPALGSTLSDPEVAVLLADSNTRRERYWLEQLRVLNVSPLLFVCGPDHVVSFVQLLKREDIAVRVAAENWASNTTVERDTPQAARPSL